MNPYTRPEKAVRTGEIPHGAQTLSALAQAPGGGRDLYASPDGNVYRRTDQGWYRRDPGNKWNFVAPTQGTVQGDRVVAAGGSEAAGARAGNGAAAARANAAGGGQALRNRVPNAGSEARASQVASLERDYYARSLSQARQGNWSAARSVSRPARGGRR